jgi:hypothetical protein
MNRTDSMSARKTVNALHAEIDRLRRALEDAARAFDQFAADFIEGAEHDHATDCAKHCRAAIAKVAIEVKVSTIARAAIAMAKGDTPRDPRRSMREAKHEGCE